MMTGTRKPLSADEFRQVMGHFASGVTVVTTSDEGTPYGTTANAVSSLSLEPPMLLICMSRSSLTGQAIERSRAFAVNILAEHHHELAVRFAGKGGGKFAGVAVADGPGGQPLLADALATLECSVAQYVHAATHTVFLAEVEHAEARDGTPLAYFQGRFHRLSALFPPSSKDR